MNIKNPNELVGKEVVDTNGEMIGWIDKTWNSWSTEYPGHFFGIRPDECVKDTWFRGSHKLIPIYSDYIKEVGDKITLTKTVKDLFQYWNKSFHYGPLTWQTDELFEKPVYDRNYSRVGTFYTWVEYEGTVDTYGCFIDPYLCDIWKLPTNTILPIPTHYIHYVKDGITLDKTLDELKQFWKQYFTF
jgi:sporulation protein YlmC with PRC-barrel domain